MSAAATESRLEKELHDLCQPLTTLQCRLEYAQMVGDEETMKGAIEGGLQECARMFAGIAAMRQHLLDGQQADKVGR